MYPWVSVLEGCCEVPEAFKYDFPARENWSIPLAEGPIYSQAYVNV